MNRILDPVVGQMPNPAPSFNLRAETGVPGMLLLFWTDSKQSLSSIRILNAAGTDYWNGRPVNGQSLLMSDGTAGEGMIQLPPDDYVVQLLDHGNGDWRELTRWTVTVTPPVRLAHAAADGAPVAKPA